MSARENGHKYRRSALGEAEMRYPIDSVKNTSSAEFEVYIEGQSSVRRRRSVGRNNSE